MGESERLKYVFIWGTIEAIVCLLVFMPWSLASLVASTQSRKIYDLVIHYPLVSTSISALPGGSTGTVPNYLIVEGILFLVAAILSLIVAYQWSTFKEERKEHIRQRVKRSYR